MSTGSEVALRRDIAATLLPGFTGTQLPDWLRERLRNGLGGVCVFGPNIVSLDQLTRLNREIREANPAAVIAIDEEGGDVTRLFYDVGSPFPGNAVLGRIDDLAYTESVARSVGEALLEVGCTITFAPDVDINSNPLNPVIGVRSFGADPELVAAHGSAWTTSIQNTGIAACAKHFPGHGDTSVDSHHDVPVIGSGLDDLSARELVPFRAVIAAGVRAVMTSHILVPEIDPQNIATFSAAALGGVLRERLGFDGLVVTDALDMRGASGAHGMQEAAVRALAAGCDLLCLGTDNTDDELSQIEAAVMLAVAEGRLSRHRIADAADRVRALAEWTARAPAGPHAVGGLTRSSGEARLIAGSFDLSERGARWIERARDAGAVDTLVRCDTALNIAVGVAPWGPFAVTPAELSEAANGWISGATIVGVDGDDPALLGDDPGSVMLVGKDIHRHEFARAFVDRLRAADVDLLVVDMGWPSNDREYADLATFGASRLVGRALIEFAAGTVEAVPR